MTLFRFFNAKEAKTFSVLSRCVLALENHEDESNVVNHIDAFLSDKDVKTQKTFHLLLFVFECLSFLVFLKPFPRLSRGAQEKYLSLWENAPVKKLRTGFFGLKTLALLGYYTDEKCWGEIGYDGPELTKNKQ